MTISLLGSLTGALLGWLMGFLSFFLILLILIQRGKGGGLTGALGGPGGQSAFGSKAGDTFTVITIVMASIWGFTCAFTMWLLGTHTPTAVTETSVTAGPGDDAATTGESEMIIPPAGNTGIGSLDNLNLDDLNLGGETSVSSETPSMELTPAAPESPAEATEPTTETPAPPGEETPDDAAPSAEAAATQSPTGQEPAAGDNTP